MRRFIFVFLLLALLSGCTVREPDPTQAEPAVTDATTVPSEASPSQETESIQEAGAVQESEENVETTAPAPEPQAERIESGVKILYGGLDLSHIMSDGSHLTKYYIASSGTLRISSETAFSSVYIQWDAIPGEYELVWEGGDLLCGTNDFLHEYVVLPQEVHEVTFRFNQAGQRTLCDAFLYTCGSAPEGIQVWLPPCEEADILVFPTHADDDVLFFGPMISYYTIEQGLAVQTAFMVDHSWQYERNHERLNGLWEMGVRHYPVVGSAPDTGEHDFTFGLSYYSNSNILEWQVEQIRRFHPLVIVGHDLDGEYGNCGHKVNAYYLLQAVEAAADPDAFPVSAEIWGAWDTPKFYIHLYPENEWYFDVNTPLSSDPMGRTPFQIAVDAFKCHVSQNTGYLYVHQEDDDRQWDCRPFGLYRTLVGLDTTADVMENIDRYQWRKQ